MANSESLSVHRFAQSGIFGPQTIDCRSRQRAPAYDMAGRQTGEHCMDGSSGGAGHFITYTFDNDSELTQAANSNATLTFSYDSGGRVTTAVTSGPSGTQPLVTLAYGFDNAGNRTSLTDSLSNIGRVTYVYLCSGQRRPCPGGQAMYQVFPGATRLVRLRTASCSTSVAGGNWRQLVSGEGQLASTRH
jgi:hypothetical protein